ncbi:Sensor histidine kinase regulating citrate/malate metabolism [Terribacillus saccharophilus]|uniref:histidine kinase n=1 Tax=Terribacillus saccharophilus TaxID=361277 RepID=A0AAX2EIX7_9BACI|nr:sensor histidine kinase [Terribacillus saccharophilus]MCM3226046.1 sensor histidine kinase [Terribacillus saccharophilus]SEN91852.1 Sensor histidine kinase regulating citrate/malate metabolism [Terribacillus saccharophilus]
MGELRRRLRLGLLGQIVLLVTILLVISLLFVSALFIRKVDEIVEEDAGNTAMAVAKLAAKDDTILQHLEDRDNDDAIQQESLKIQQNSGADYVVIADTNGIRISHPEPERIGKPTKTSNDQVLEEGKEVIYEGYGISGYAVKAKTPIRNESGDIIGVASVGFLKHNLNDQILSYLQEVLIWFLLIFAVGLLGAYLVAKRVKKLIYGLEPEEISFLFKEKETTLASIKDATIAIDRKGHITSINRRAQEIFKRKSVLEDAIDQTNLQSLYQAVLADGEGRYNKYTFVAGDIYIVDASPIKEAEETWGVVFTLRPESEVIDVSETIAKMKQQADQMRASNHEFMNKLNTLYGLISLQQYDKALRLISEEVEEQQSVVNVLMASIKEPMIAACLLGKFNRAKELKVILTIDESSSMNVDMRPEATEKIVTIIGNLLENAFESASKHQGTEGKVYVSFTDLGQELIFDIEDNGKRLSEKEKQAVLVDGYSTKKEAGDGHGIGLTIVQAALEKLDGALYYGDSEAGGTLATVVLPKGSVENGSDERSDSGR